MQKFIKLKNTEYANIVNCTILRRKKKLLEWRMDKYFSKYICSLDQTGNYVETWAWTTKKNLGEGEEEFFNWLVLSPYLCLTNANAE